MPFPWVTEERRCVAISKATGERCRQGVVNGKDRCCRHGGGNLAKAGAEAFRKWRNLVPAVRRAGWFPDDLPMFVPAGGRVVLAEALLASVENGDPILYQQARRAVAARYKSRLRFLGKHEFLTELGIE